MQVDDILDALYLQAKDQIGLTRLRDIVLTDESITRLQFNREGQEPIIFIKERHGRWIYDEKTGNYYCSECRRRGGVYIDEAKGVELLGNYCGNCGAVMDEVEE